MLVPPEFQCNLCGKFKTTSAAGLKIHQGKEKCKRDQGINPTESFVCTECGKSFQSQQGLSIHETTHGSLHRTKIAAAFEDDVVEVEKENERKLEIFKGRMLQWKASFIRLRNGPSVDVAEFNELVIGFSNELSKCVDFLPGPKNPNRRFFNLRKKVQRQKMEVQPASRTGFTTSSNPERSDKRKKAK